MVGPRTLTILALPRDANPYQELLYAPMRERGARVVYLGELTRSRTLNVALLPFEVLARRAGARCVVHLHWAFAFTLPVDAPWARKASQLWFELFLAVVRATRTPLVWTAHNVLPHAPVFADDRAARGSLVRASSLVVAHAQHALDRLAAMGLHPRRQVVLPHGPMPLPHVERVRRGPDRAFRVAFVGAVAAYKGVEELVRQFLLAPLEHAELVVAGGCDDPSLAGRLHALVRGDDRVTLRLERLSDLDLARELASAEVLALPFTEITTSGSCILGLTAGVPLIVPDLAALEDLPSTAVFRYAATDPGGLRDAIVEAATCSPSRLDRMARSGQEWAYRRSWDQIGADLYDAMRALVREHVSEPTPLARRR